MNQISLRDYDAVAFDVEGTLANTIPAHHASRIAAFEANGQGHITHEQHALGSLYGSTSAAIIGGILHAAGVIPKQESYDENLVVQNIIAAKTRLFGEIAAEGFVEMPGSTNFFKDVAGHFSTDKRALVTASSLPFIQPFINRYELDEWVLPELTITEETIQARGLRAKPAPDPYILAMNRLHVHAEKLLVFEDTVSGVAAAKTAGATVVALGFDPHNAAAFRKGGLEYPPDYFVNDYDEARALVNIPKRS